MENIKDYIKSEKFAEIEVTPEKNFGYEQWHYTVSANIVDYGTHKDINLTIENVENNKEVVVSLWKLTQGQLDIIKDAIRLHEKTTNHQAAI